MLVRLFVSLFYLRLMDINFIHFTLEELKFFYHGNHYKDFDTFFIIFQNLLLLYCRTYCVDESFSKLKFQFLSVKKKILLIVILEKILIGQILESTSMWTGNFNFIVISRKILITIYIFIKKRINPQILRRSR